MRYFLLIASLCFAFLVACGDDDSNNPVVVKDLPSSGQDSVSSSSNQDGPDDTKDSSEVSNSSMRSSSGKSSASSGKSSAASSSSSLKSVSSSSASSRSVSSNSYKPSTGNGEAEIMPSGTYDCSTYKCVTTEFLNQSMLAAGEYGEFLDERDGQVYKTIQIDFQTWMAQNLNYDTTGSFCYNSDSTYCDSFGRLYSWKTVTGRKDCGYNIFCSLPPSVQGVCPDGWHLPSREEWMRLFDNVGMHGIGSSDNLLFAGGVLKAQTGWNLHSGLDSYNGQDEYGFSAIPSGVKQSMSYVWIENSMYAWTSSEADEASVYQVRFYYSNSTVTVDPGKKEFSNAVRCLKNSDIKILPNSSSSMPNYSSQRAFDLEDKEDSLETLSRDDYLNPALQYDSLVDPRDGQVYKTTKIGHQVWMAQNLNYADSVRTPILAGNSWCYKDKPENCALLGRYYDWDASLEVCPEGWHLPSSEEWTTLQNKFGGNTNAGKYLRARLGWIFRNGADEYGFSAIPAGGRYADDPDDDTVGYLYLGGEAFFWSSSALDEKTAYRMNISYSSDLAHLGLYTKYFGHSVRCIQD